MSAIHVMEYLIGLAVFGLTYWLFNGIFVEIRPVSETGDILNLINFVWTGAIVIYLIFGGIWLARKYSEREYTRGGGLF